MKNNGFFLAFCVLDAIAFAQTAPGSMFDLNSYNSYFGFRKAEINWDNKYVINTSVADNEIFGNLGAALYQEIQVLRFRGDTAAAGRYEGMLKFVQDRNNVTRGSERTV
jgi:hypothetical protein